jgi:electron transport complex protein RnfD
MAETHELEPRWKRRLADNREARQWNWISLLLTLPLLATGFYYYGAQVLRTAAIAGLTALLLELAVGRLLLHMKMGDDWNAVVTGVWIACMLPAQMATGHNPALYAVAGAAFAVLCVKIPFGGTMRAPFTPAAAGFASLAVCFPNKVFAYAPSQLVAPVHGKSLAAMLQQGRSAMESKQFMSILLGNAVGPMGTCVIIVLAAALLAQLCMKERRSTVLVSAGFLCSAAFIAFCIPRVVGPAWKPNGAFLQLLADYMPRTFGSGLHTRFASVGMELCAGSLLFAAVFLLPDPAIMPARRVPRFLWGVMAGALGMLLRDIGSFEEGVCFAVLLADAFMPFFYRLQSEYHIRRQRAGKAALTAAT